MSLQLHTVLSFIKYKFDILIMNHDWLLTTLRFNYLYIFRLQPTENLPFPSVYSTSWFYIKLYHVFFYIKIIWMTYQRSNQLFHCWNIEINFCLKKLLYSFLYIFYYYYRILFRDMFHRYFNYNIDS